MNWIACEDLSLFLILLIEIPMVAYAVGETCETANTEPCGSSGTYIEAMNICVKEPTRLYGSWWQVVKMCQRDKKSFLLEPNTEERIKAVSAHAKEKALRAYWVGLSFNRNTKEFVWSKYGNPLTKRMRESFGTRLRKDRCVVANIGLNSTKLKPEHCAIANSFLCGRTSEFMPRRPEITVHYENWLSVEFEAGIKVKVSCDAMLSQKGDLKIVIFSETETKFYSEGDANVEYSESLKKDTDGLCKRHGVINVALKMSFNMDGQTLACISYIDEAFQMCSESDQYCDIAGAIRIMRGPRGAVCLVAIDEPCFMPGSEYIDELNSCVFRYRDFELPWRLAIDTCHDDQGVLMEPNTEKRLLAVAKYARDHRIDRYWIGLSFDSHYTNDFIWSQYGNVLTKEMHKHFGDVLSRGTCVAVIPEENSAWVQEDCQRNSYFFCDAKSEFMPKRPTISKGLFNNATTEKMLEGTEMRVTCEAVLSYKGYLRIVIFSDVESQFFGFNNTGVIYNESHLFDEDLLCKRHGVINVSLRMTLDMDGKTLACVSFTDEAFEMCSTADRYCHVAGVLRVYSETKVTEVLASVFPWWIILVLVLVMSTSMMMLQMLVKRMHHSTGRGETEKLYLEDPAEESITRRSTL